MISYKPLQHLLVERGIKKTELLKIAEISSATGAKLWKDDIVSLDVIDRICNALDCEIADVIEHKKEPTQ